jgi:hypothetical protein
VPSDVRHRRADRRSDPATGYLDRLPKQKTWKYPLMPARQRRSVAEKRSARVRPVSYPLAREQYPLPARKIHTSACLTVPTRRISQEVLVIQLYRIQEFGSWQRY